jgi:hypothetical protein
MPAPGAAPLRSAGIRLVAKKNQRRELIEQAGSLDGGPDQDEERGKQGNPPVHHLEQLIEDQRQGDVGHGHHYMHRQAGTVQQLMRLDVGGGGRRIGRQQPGLNIADGKSAADDVDQIEGSSDPRQLTP